MLFQIIKYYHTVKHLKWIQIYGQFTFRFKKPKLNFSSPPAQRKLTADWTVPIQKLLPLCAPNKLSFLNQERDISEKTIWTDATIDKLWLYNLHYFNGINSLSADFIQRWISENPPPSGCGWEPYPTSLRIVNWIKWILAGNEFTADMLHSLAIQVRYLSKRIEIHLLGNHILANAKALLFAGLFFTGTESDKWIKKGLKLFKNELSAQILADGAHFELSPMYHSIILEDLLDVINISQTCRHPIPSDWLKKCDQMFHWLCSMCHLDGHISFFNDAALNIAPTLNDLEDYRQRLAINHNISPIRPLTFLSYSGYCRIQRNNIVLLADVANIGASYQPGHAHADTLSFELSIGQQRLIVNSGTSCYTDNEERLRQRGSEAHNTLVVNDRDSSEVWKSFRVARRAKVQNIVISEEKDNLYLKATHDGYYRKNKIKHTRRWKMTDNELMIEDESSGSGSHKIKLYFHIHPDIKLTKQDNDAILFYDKTGKMIATLQVNGETEIVASTYHPAFNLSVPNHKIVTEIQQNLPVYFHTSIKFNL